MGNEYLSPRRLLIRMWIEEGNFCYHGKNAQEWSFSKVLIPSFMVKQFQKTDLWGILDPLVVRKKYQVI